MKTELYDVVAVRIDDSTVRLLAESKTALDANAIQTMAVMRRGVDVEFFALAQHGSYKDGDIWDGNP